MDTGYSLADIGAMLGNKSDGFLEGNGIIILILFFLIFGANGGGFGSWGGNSAAAAQINNDFLYNNLSRQIGETTQGMTAGFANLTQDNFGLQKDILNQTNIIQSSLCQGFNGVNMNINNLAAQMAQQCCDLKTTIHTEAETTRALITEQEVTRLRTDLQSAQLALSNANQTQNILNNLGSYQPYGGCGCQ